MRSNSAIVQYFVDATGKSLADEISWCAAFVGAMLKRAGREPSGSVLARSYLKWGVACEPVPGAIVIFPRGEPWQGHVAIIESVDRMYLTVIGGNQNDAVTRKKFPRSKALGYRWPKKGKT